MVANRKESDSTNSLFLSLYEIGYLLSTGDYRGLRWRLAV